MTPKEILVAARNLLGRPNGWTQGTLARDKEGASISYSSEEACCFCTIGAVDRACKLTSQASTSDFLAITGARNAALDMLSNALNTHDLALWNDRTNRTQGHVVCLFDVAINRFPE